MSLLRLKQLAQDAAASGQAIVWDGTKWAPSTPAGVPLLSDDLDGSPVASDDGSDWLYTDT
ncbi:MAG: hypothetical protein ACXV5Q_00650 [Frankiaceae bacterium]